MVMGGNRRRRHLSHYDAFALAKAMTGPCPRLMTPKLTAKNFTRIRALAVRTGRM